MKGDNYEEGLTQVAATLRKINPGTAAFVLRARDELAAKEKELAEAKSLLGLIVMKWVSDPKSVRCFDLRLVERARQIIAAREGHTLILERKTEGLKNE